MEKKMKYPYISTEMNNLLFYAKDTAMLIGDESNSFSHGFKITVDESKLENNTPEYLSNTYGEVASPEHAEFIVEIASKAGFFIACDYSDSIKFFCTNNESLVFCRAEQNAKRERKKITIPLPPKADKQEYSSKPLKIGDEVETNLGLGHIRLMPDVNDNYIALINGHHIPVNAVNVKKLKAPKKESGEWPQIGDDVIAVHESNNLKGKLLALTKKYAIISQESEEQHLHLSAWTLEKTKTLGEDLRDELEIALNSYVISDKPASEHIDEIINLFKKPQ